MAPELVRDGGDAAGPEADIYSFGVILYEIAHGKNPFSELPSKCHANNQPKKVTNHNPF